jgi:acyl transferase domain-containing protein
MNTAKLSILSPTSTCHTFDASADGYGRAEGAGALYLKRLSDAIRDGDVIRSVIRSSAVNTNGKIEGSGLTHPSVKGQERVVRAAYERAKLDPNNTAYLECHGTGTPVGDPIEVRAISNAMTDTRSAESPLLLGAIKANIGHSEAASGIFAVMKAAMMTESAMIPGVCGLKNLNPAIKENDWNVKINVDTRSWPEDFELRRASVSSFGYGGTNGHVILESADNLCPLYQHGKPKAIANYQYHSTRPLLLGMSAHDKRTLIKNIDAHQGVVDEYYLPDVAYTLNSRRTKFSSRGFTIASEGQAAAAFNASSFELGTASSRPVKLGFVFTGQGAQWAGMGLEAIQNFPTFSKTIDALDGVLQSISPAPRWTIRQLLQSPKETSRVSEAGISQPLCTAIQIAIVDLFASWDILPTVTVGHSSGEIGAAYAAGRLSAPEAILAAYFRGLAVEKAAPIGTMLAAGIGASEAEKYIPELVADQVAIACENSPSSVTFSGTSAGINAVKEQLDNAKIFARELRTGKAYHSSQMAAVAPLYNELFLKASQSLTEASFAWCRPTAHMVSSVTGELHTDNNVSIQYWCENLRSRVLFNSALTTLGESELFSDVNCVVEIGPHSALAGPIKQICSANEFSHLAYISSLARGSDSSIALLKTAGNLYLKGLPVDFEEINNIIDYDAPETFGKNRPQPRYVPDLPPYQWNYENKFWYEPRFSAESRKSKFPRHDILGRQIFGLSNNSISWKNVLRHRDVPWLKDHHLGGSSVFPGAGHFSLAVEAYLQALDVGEGDIPGVTLRDVNIKTALIIPETDDGIEIQTRLQKISSPEDGSAWYTFTVESIDNGVWTTHSEGKIGRSVLDHEIKQDSDYPFKSNKLHQRTLAKRWYDSFKTVGFEYGPSFQTLSSIRTNGKDRAAAAGVHVTDGCGLMNTESRYMLHPSTIDGCLQLLNVSVHSGLHKEMPYGVVPLALEEINLYFPESDCAAEGNAVSCTDNVNGRYHNTNIQLRGASGRLLLDIKSLRSVAYEAAVPPRPEPLPAKQPYTKASWEPDVTALSADQVEGVFPSDLSKDQALAKMVYLLNHQKPVENAIIFGNASIGLLTAVKASLPSTSTLTVALTSEEEVEKVQSMAESAFFTTIVLTEDMSELSEDLIATQDLLIVDESLPSQATMTNLLSKLKTFASETGYLIANLQKSDVKSFSEISSSSGFATPRLSIEAGSVDIILANTEPVQDEVVHLKQKTSIVSMENSDMDAEKLAEELGENNCEVVSSNIEDVDITHVHEIIVNDCAGNILSHPTKESFNALKAILCSGKSIVWITKGINQGSTISGGMAQGFLRAVRSEQIAARISLVDIDLDVSIHDATAVILDRLQHNRVKDSGLDTEFWVQKGGVVHVPRLIPQDALNDIFSGDSTTPVEAPMNDGVAYKGCIVGKELVFKSQSCTSIDESLGEREAEIQVTLCEISGEDLSTESERPRICTGKVVNIGSSLEPSLVGQEVVTYTKGYLETRIKSSSFTPTTKLLEASQVIATLPGLCNVVQAVVNTGKAKAGDHVLLLPSKFSFVDAVSRLGKVIGFQVSAVVADAEEKQKAITKYGLDASSLLIAEDLGTVRELLSSQSAPNVVIANSFSTLSQETWRFMLPLSRFVLCDTTLEVPLETLPLTRGASFLTSGLSTLFAKDQSALNSLLRSAIELACQHKDILVQSAGIVDVGSLKDIETVGSDAGFLEHGALKFRYGESVVQVSIIESCYARLILIISCRLKPPKMNFNFLPKLPTFWLAVLEV